MRDILDAMAVYDASTALLVVDVQNDFADPKGGLYVQGAEQIIGLINQEVSEARKAGAQIVFTQDWHPAVTAHFEKDGGIWPVHCVAGTWGADLYPDLDYRSPEPIVRKGVGGEDGYSGFTVRDPKTGLQSATDLDSILRSNDIQSVTIVGLATDYCVQATAIDAVRSGFKTTVLLDCIRSVDLKPGDGEKAVDEMRQAGVGLA